MSDNYTVFKISSPALLLHLAALDLVISVLVFCYFFFYQGYTHEEKFYKSEWYIFGPFPADLSHPIFIYFIMIIFWKREYMTSYILFSENILIYQLRYSFYYVMLYIL